MTDSLLLTFCFPPGSLTLLPASEGWLTLGCWLSVSSSWFPCILCDWLCPMGFLTRTFGADSGDWLCLCPLSCIYHVSCSLSLAFCSRIWVNSHKSNRWNYHKEYGVNSHKSNRWNYHKEYGVNSYKFQFSSCIYHKSTARQPCPLILCSIHSLSKCCSRCHKDSGWFDVDLGWWWFSCHRQSQ